MLSKQDKEYLEEKYYDKAYLDEQFRGIAWKFERVHEKLDRLVKKFDFMLDFMRDAVEKFRQHDQQLSDHEKRIRGIETLSLN